MKKNSLILLVILAVAILGGSFFAYKFWNSNSDSFTEDQFVGNKKIEIYNLKPNQVVSSPVTLEGKAKGWYFEASFPIDVVDENGELLGQGIAQAQSDWMTEEFVPFKAQVSFIARKGGSGKIIFRKDNPSGLPEFDESFEVPVKFDNSETTVVKIYVGSNRGDEDVYECEKVLPVERLVEKVPAIGTSALNELLKGITQEEKNLGYFTSINNGVKLNKLAITDGVATADFDEQLQFQVGGSCRIAAIRAQITETLKQFPTVKSVIISINGRTEDILQP